jgi:hypothetical protein
MSAKMSEDQDEGGVIASSFIDDVEEGEDGESEASVGDGPVFGDNDSDSPSSTETGGVSCDELSEYVASIEYPHPEPYNNTRLECELSDVADLVSPYSVTMTLVSGATVEVRIHPGDPSSVRVIYHNKAGQFVKEDTAADIGGVGVSAESVFGEILEKLVRGAFPGDVVERLR